MSTIILGIESSCDETSAAIISNETILSNSIAGQAVHKDYGGVVPELASRAHQQNIIPVVEHSLKKAGVKKSEISAVAFTRGPGLLGALLVGTSFAKGFALANKVPLIEVNHLQAHILSHFIREEGEPYLKPEFPFLCLLVSGGHTEIVLVKSHYEMEVLGKTIDDAAGEAFDKCAKVMGLPYPGGPLIDKYSKSGNPESIKFSKPTIDGYNYSFSGLKTSFLYYLRDQLKIDEKYIEKNMYDICSSLQKTIIDILMEKLVKASNEYNVKQIAIAGGVSANSGLRETIINTGIEKGWKTFIPKFSFSTDNAAMIAITGYYKYLRKEFVDQTVAPLARFRY